MGATARLSDNSECCVPPKAEQEQLQCREGDGKWHSGRKGEEDSGQRNLIESRSGRLVTPSNQT